VFTYDLTYGSLAGSMVTLLFFWLVGLGLVIGAELNAALALEARDATAGEALEENA
jgi:membrane protein